MSTETLVEALERRLREVGTHLALLCASRIEAGPDGCVEWAGTRNNGYGVLRHRGKGYRAHRVVYEVVTGQPIPTPLVLDHLCRNPACVNPQHLEPVTIRENTLRGVSPVAKNAAKTHCRRGHPFAPENTRKTRGRICLACARIDAKAFAEKHPDRMKGRWARYKRENREKVRESNKARPSRAGWRLRKKLALLAPLEAP